MASVSVEGLDPLRRALKALDNDAPKELRDITRKGAEIVANEAKQRAPKLTGKLGRTIKPAVIRNGAMVKVGGSLPYAKPIIFGWARHNIEPNKFPYEALDAKRPQVIRHFQTEIDQLIKRRLP